MQPRIDYRRFAQEPLKHMLALEKYIAESGLDPKLIHLVKMRASQINGCAYCLDMHSIDARALGESEQRLYTLEAWRETPFLSDREHAALAWTELLVDFFFYPTFMRHFKSRPRLRLFALAWATPCSSFLPATWTMLNSSGFGICC